MPDVKALLEELFDVQIAYMELCDLQPSSDTISTGKGIFTQLNMKLAGIVEQLSASLEQEAKPPH